jgi:hypothetical protein
VEPFRLTPSAAIFMTEHIPVKLAKRQLPEP